ncbi:MAG: response regulator [Candidatus Pacebacteria bacterium]|jgi:CheY-like chemotaxis protein|nr:response regulator [Candidatus Paceibacterota bacterium]
MTELKPVQLVYLIDDDTFLLDMYALKFKECGLPVEAINDPALALEKIRQGAKPDIILVDVIMPGMTGFDFLEALQKENLVPDARRVVLSNQGQQEDIDTAMKFGAMGYIIKASAIPSEVCDKVIAITKTA